MIDSCRPVQFAMGGEKPFVVADRWASLNTASRRHGGTGDFWGWTSPNKSLTMGSSDEHINCHPASFDYVEDLQHDLIEICQLDPTDVFPRAKWLLRCEIERCMAILQRQTPEANRLPSPVGPIVKLVEKLPVPVKDFPDYNFAGRILGPRGMTVKQLEQETGCKIMVKGRNGEGKPSDVQLHVVVTAEDTHNRAELKLRRGVAEVTKLLRPNPDGTDDLKRKQLMEVAIINGTYRPPSHPRSPVANFMPPSYIMAMPSPPAVFVPSPIRRQQIFAIPPPPPQVRSKPIPTQSSDMSDSCKGLLTQLGIDLKI